MRSCAAAVVVVVAVFVGRALGVSKLEGNSTVIYLQESFIPHSSSFARWTGSIPRPLTAVTICYRVKIFYYRPIVTVFSYIDMKGRKFQTDHNRIGMRVRVAAYRYTLNTDLVTPLMHWSAFCVAITQGQPATVFSNGKRVLTIDDSSPRDDQSLESELIPKNDFLPSLLPGDSSSVLMDINGSIVLGQEQSSLNGKFDASQSLSGGVTEVNVWSRVLKDSEMASVTSCRARLQGDVLAWDEAEFELGQDTSLTERELNVTCNVVPEPYLLFPVRLEAGAGVTLCEALGGEMVTPRNDDEQRSVYTLAERSSNICAKEGGPLIWLGMTRDAETHKWYYSSTGQEATYFRWAIGHPNSRATDDCAVMRGRVLKGEWENLSCQSTYKLCVMCALQPPVFLRLRGVCDPTLFDNRFVMAGTVNGKPYFRGYFRSHIYFTEEDKWQLQNVLDNVSYAEMHNDGSFSLPIGRRLWRFSHNLCGISAYEDHSLTLTQCKRNKQFTCDDGTCIGIREVCDRRDDCPDRSDELDCSIVQRPRGYRTTLPPPSVVPGNPFPVYLNVTLISFANIDAINNRFKAEIMVRMIWKDNRLSFKHLSRDQQLNVILPAEAKQIWVPTLDFMNAEENRQTVVDNAGHITILRLGGALPDVVENSKEASIYRGLDSYIHFARKYSINFMCNFNFFYYPFNTDYCSMIFRVSKITNDYVSLEKFWQGTSYEGMEHLAEYFIGGLQMVRYETEEPYSGLRTVIRLRHLFTTQMVTVFIPTTLINIISFATFFFKWFDFQNRVMVSLTTLLVLSTLFSQTSDSLPKTSYFKVIDIWFLSSIVFTFLTIITHTIVEYYHRYGSNVSANPKSSVSSFLPSKVAPIGVSSEEFRAQQKELLFRERWGRSMPEMVDKIGFYTILGLYSLFFVLFWGSAFTQKIKEDMKTIVSEVNEVSDYPYKPIVATEE